MAADGHDVNSHSCWDFKWDSVKCYCSERKISLRSFSHHTLHMQLVIFLNYLRSQGCGNEIQLKLDLTKLKGSKIFCELEAFVNMKSWFQMTCLSDDIIV